MSAIGSQGSALSTLGITPWPIGTLIEIQREGLDPENVASCHPPKTPGVRSCPMAPECPFHLKAFNHGKWMKYEDGPRYVGYLHVTHEGRKQENFLSCHAFVRTMYARMRAGDMARMEGKPHEFIRIIAQEGEKIQTRVGVAVDPTNKDSAWAMKTLPVTIPAFPRPGENPQLTYEQGFDARLKKLLRAEEDAANSVYTRLGEEPEETFDIGATAEPVVEGSPGKGGKAK